MSCTVRLPFHILLPYRCHKNNQLALNKHCISFNSNFSSALGLLNDRKCSKTPNLQLDPNFIAVITAATTEISIISPFIYSSLLPSVPVGNRGSV